MMQRILVSVLSLAVMLSALGVVYTKHESRKLFVNLQKLQDTQDDLNVEWGQLQLEQSTWATQGRIEEIARDKLAMQLPQPGTVVIVKP